MPILNFSLSANIWLSFFLIFFSRSSSRIKKLLHAFYQTIHVFYMLCYINYKFKGSAMFWSASLLMLLAGARIQISFLVKLFWKQLKLIIEQYPCHHLLLYFWATLSNEVLLGSVFPPSLKNQHMFVKKQTQKSRPWKKNRKNWWYVRHNA